MNLGGWSAAVTRHSIRCRSPASTSEHHEGQAELAQWTPAFIKRSCYCNTALKSDEQVENQIVGNAARIRSWRGRLTGVAPRLRGKGCLLTGALSPKRKCAGFVRLFEQIWCASSRSCDFVWPLNRRRLSPSVCLLVAARVGTYLPSSSGRWTVNTKDMILDSVTIIAVISSHYIATTFSGWQE